MQFIGDRYDLSYQTGHTEYNIRSQLLVRSASSIYQYLTGGKWEYKILPGYRLSRGNTHRPLCDSSEVAGITKQQRRYKIKKRMALIGIWILNKSVHRSSDVVGWFWKPAGPQSLYPLGAWCYLWWMKLQVVCNLHQVADIEYLIGISWKDEAVSLKQFPLKTTR